MKPRFHQVVRIVGVCVTLWCGAAQMSGVENNSPAPELSISLRGVGGGTIEVGEPFRVAARLDAPQEPPAILTLAPANGSWIEATAVELLSADGQAVRAKARPIVASAGPLTTLDVEHAANGLWWFDSDSLSTLTPGTYSVRARLVIRDGTGWKGEVMSEPAELQVVAASSDPERVTQRTLALADAAIIGGEPEKGASILDAVLETNPDNVPVLSMRAALCLHGGNRAAAEVCIHRALMLDARFGGEPSVALRALADRIAESADNNPGTQAVPTWAIPPRSVFSPLRSPVESTAAAAISTPATPAKNGASAGAPSVTLPASSDATRGMIVSSAALDDAKTIADAAGQWAAGATASSQYGTPGYSAAQAVGAPNISLGMAGDDPDAWCPATKNEGTAWLELAFATPVHASEVRVRQNNAPGAIARVELIDAEGTSHLVWEGVDPFVAPAVREIAWFAVRVPKTGYLVAKVKLTLNLAAVNGWKQIDAVQLVGTAE
jgi:hypothetical protein